ncbi:hypothetical protein NDN08_007515 [Rhodosorus marinus]|uniref:PUM-HD domain-containing protein n=1 Tax=Rhodosorus marinus TaxID=101924 RepID=A0AAV8V1W5_9RHOD|nr:hypothetical protein NDN08_007515 [Rhodosorus marinus]
MADTEERTGRAKNRKERRQSLQVKKEDKRKRGPKKDDKKRKRTDSNEKDAGEKQAKSPKALRIETAQEAKKLWEKLRNRKEKDKGSDTELVAKIIDVLRGDLNGFSHRHDTARIVQWVLKCGNREQRSEVVQGLLPHVLPLSSDRYGRHVVMSALTKGRASRGEVLAIYERFRGNVYSMCKNNLSAEVLDMFYQMNTTSGQRKELCIELLHGKEGKLLSSFRQKKKMASSLEEVIAEAGPEFGKLLYDGTKTILIGFAEKESTVRLQIVHDVLHYFLIYACEHDKEGAAEMAALYAPVAVHLIHTKNGAASFVACLKLLDAKNRKKLIKSVQEDIRKISEDPYGHLTIMALYEHVDDTKLLQKAVLKPHIGKSDSEELSTLLHRYSSLPLLNLLAPHEGRYFNPANYAFVWTGETKSVKDDSKRRQELVDFALPLLIESAQKNAVELLCDPAGSKILLELVVKDSPLIEESWKTEILSKVADALTKEVEPSDGEADSSGTPQMLDSASAVRTAKYLIALTKDESYSLGDLIHARLKGNLDRLQNGKSDLILKQMSKIEGSKYYKEALRAMED